MSLTQRALWVIERNLDQDLSLDAIAAACGVTKFHLSHAFGQTTGRSVMQVMRARRLSEAAQRLASGAPDILAIAIQTGYGSHEAFSRAFKTMFGVTPESVRAMGKDHGLPLVDPLRVDAADEIALSPPSFVEAPQMFVTGLAQRRGYDTTHLIPGQWQSFMTDFAWRIDDKTGDIPLGIAWDIDDNGEFNYMACVETRARVAPSDGLTSFAIAPRTWAVFGHEGHVEDLRLTYAAIWDRWLPSQKRIFDGGPCLERHRATFDPRTGEGGVDVWISLSAAS
jgi:AraC family transcriptional regulator